MIVTIWKIKLNYVNLSTPNFHTIDKIKFVKYFYKFHLETLVRKEQQCSL